MAAPGERRPAAGESAVEPGVSLWQSVVGALKLPFVRGVAAVSGAAVVAQVITILVAPITSRQYGPAAYGVAGVFISVASMLSSLAGMTYPMAISLPEKDDDALALLGLSVRIALAAAAALAVVFLALHGLVARVAGLPDSRAILAAVVIVVLFSGLTGGLGQWLIRKKRFRRLGALSAVQSAAVNGSRVIAGAIAPSAAVLIGIVAAGSAFGALLLWVSARGSLAGALAARRAAPEGPPTTRERRREVARRYRDFPLYREPQQLLNTAAANLPLLLLAGYFGSVVAGWWGLCLNVLTLPSILVGDAVGKVYLPHAAEKARRGEPVRPLLVRSTLTLLVLGAVAFGALFILGPWLFSVVFGPQWATAGEYARWLALGTLPSFVNTPSMQTIPLLGLQGRLLVFEIVQTVARLGAILVGAALMGSALASVVLFAVVGLVTNTLLVVYVVHASAARRREAY
jgi:O-antigen/teichoic acid export membrane protein